MGKQKGPHCGALLRDGSGRTCTRPAGWGTKIHVGFGRCKLHGGTSPSGITAGVEQAARFELAKLGVPAVDDPLTELAKVTGEVVAWKNAMAVKVNELTSLRYEAGGAEGVSGGEQLRAEVALWERALDRCEKFLTAMARCNIDERLAKVTERQVEQIGDALALALGDMGLSAEQQRTARQGVARHLRVA